MSQARGAFAQLLRVEKAEATYGTDPSSLGAIKLPINTCGLASTRNLITPATITGTRNPVAPSQGFVDVSGSVVVPIDQYGIGYWLEMLLGTPTTTYTGSALSHVFKPNSVLNSFTFETGYTDVSLYSKFNGCKANAMSIKVGGDEELTASFDLLGATETPGTSPVDSDPTTITLTRFNQFHASLQEGGSVISTIKELEMSITNNLDTGIYCIKSGGGPTRGDLPEGLCNVSGKFSCLFENWSYYTLAISGTERNLTLAFQAGSFYLGFVLGDLIYQRQAPGISTPQGIWLEMPFQAYYSDNADETVLKVTLINTWAAYSGHI
jgi:hypothetical protein